MNIKKAKEDIKNTVSAYLAKDDSGQYAIPVLRQRPILLMGPPGIGKTQIMEQIARECQIGLVAYTITHHTRQSAVGLPFIREKVFDGKKYSVTEYTMSEIIYSIYRYMEESGRREGILFIDEINSVSETLAPTMLQFLQYKTFGNQAVPEGWIIVAAGNPPEYNRSVHDFDFVTLDRVRRIDVEPDLDAFKGYARARHLHPFIISYLELRPGNFYRTENDVDGMQFVTARGWEDLSELVLTYESLGIPVDKDLIGQFLQHEEIAADLAAYYDLYKKYRDDYDISRILSGQVTTDIYRKLFQASFDERLSCVELLISGLTVPVGRFGQKSLLCDEAFAFLKEYRSNLKEGQTDFDSLLSRKRAELARAGKSGLMTKEEYSRNQELLTLLTDWRYKPEDDMDPEDYARRAFLAAKDKFDQLDRDRKQLEEEAMTALENAFSFMEEVFGEGQEMVVFVTELTMDPLLSWFLSEHENESYTRYLSTLLLGSRRASILKELERDRIYSDPTSYSF